MHIHPTRPARENGIVLLLAVLSVFTPAAYAQRYNITYAPNSQEGLLLQLIEQLEGPAKLQQMDVFLQKYPTHASAAWILAYQQDWYSNLGDTDKALSAGEKLFSLNPDDLETAVLNQKMAEKKGDAASIQKWSAAATTAAQKLLGAPKPFYVTADDWNKRLEYAGSLVAKTEYDIYKRAVEAEKAEERLRLFDELLAKNPKSVYAVQALPYQMRAYRAIGNNGKALEFGEKLLAKDPDNEEALIIVGQIWLDKRSNYPRVTALANRLLSIGHRSAKPDNYTQEEWDRRRGFDVGAAHQLLGMASVFENKFSTADSEFKAAMPYIKGNTQAEATALFYLGWSNYYMEKYKEAANYFKACLGIPGPFQAQANKQLDGMRRERRLIE